MASEATAARLCRQASPAWRRSPAPAPTRWCRSRTSARRSASLAEHLERLRPELERLRERGVSLDVREEDLPPQVAADAPLAARPSSSPARSRPAQRREDPAPDLPAPRREGRSDARASVSANTDMLICGAEVGASKTAKAEKLGVEIVDQSVIWDQLIPCRNRLAHDPCLRCRRRARRAIVRGLRATGAPVRALVRPQSEIGDLAGRGVELAAGDFRDPESLRRAVAGAEVVVSTVTVIARALAGDRDADFRRVDEAGHRALIAAAEAAGVERFVSSRRRAFGCDRWRRPRSVARRSRPKIVLPARPCARSSFDPISFRRSGSHRWRSSTGRNAKW